MTTRAFVSLRITSSGRPPMSIVGVSAEAEEEPFEGVLADGAEESGRPVDRSDGCAGGDRESDGAEGAAEEEKSEPSPDASGRSPATSALSP